MAAVRLQVQRVAICKAMLLVLVTVVCLMADGVHGGCCVYPTPHGDACNAKTTAADCGAAGGAYTEGQNMKCFAVLTDPPFKVTCVDRPPCAPGSACDDPHITGFDGSHYMLWGKKDATYDLLSERNHQVNVRLFDDPAPTGGSHASHALFIDAVGLIINDARITVRMVAVGTENVETEVAGIISSSASSNRAGTKRMVVTAIAADGTKTHKVWSGKTRIQQTIDSHTRYTFVDESRVDISSSQISLTVHLRNNHHLDVQVNAIATSWTDVHGVLGQTYAATFGVSGTTAAAAGAAMGVAKTAANKKKLSLEGKEDDYITSGLLSTNDKFSRFVVGGSKLHVLVADASALSRKMLTAQAGAGGIVGSDSPLQGVVHMPMVRLSNAGMTGGP